MSRRCQGGVKEVSRRCQGGVKEVPTMSRRCQGGVKEVPRRCQGGVKEVSRRCQGGVKEVSRKGRECGLGVRRSWWVSEPSRQANTHLAHVPNVGAHALVDCLVGGEDELGVRAGGSSRDVSSVGEIG